MIFSLRGVNINSHLGVLAHSRFEKVGHASRYVEKKVNLLSSAVGMIIWVRPLSRCTTVKTLGWWDEPSHINQHWIRRKYKKVSSGAESKKDWVSRMFTRNHN